MILPPGTILQHLYVAERLRRRRPGTFIEVGVGRGALSRLLLRLGWHGTGVDLNPEAVQSALDTNAVAVASGRYHALVHDWLRDEPLPPVDLVISAMVIEHLADDDESGYFDRCRECLLDGGTAIVLVPSSPEHWGIEDEIAGHMRRYTAAGLTSMLHELGWSVQHVAGLTYPLSNAILPLSNLLVARAERQKLDISAQARTELSGVRDVALKTSFPSALALVLNERVLYPFHLLQKSTRRHPNALVLYAEAAPAR